MSRLEDEREGRAFFEGDRVVEGVELRGGDRNQFAVGAARVVPEYQNAAAVDRDARVEDDAVSYCESLDLFAKPRDDPRPIGPENAGLGNRRTPVADPYVQTVEAGGAQRDQYLAWRRIGLVTSSTTRTSGPPSS